MMLSFNAIQDVDTLTACKDVLNDDLVSLSGVEVEQRLEPSGELKLVCFKWSASFCGYTGSHTSDSANPDSHTLVCMLGYGQ